MKHITKVVISISVDRKLSELIDNKISNRSKYIEWLIYQDLKNNMVDGIEKIII